MEDNNPSNAMAQSDKDSNAPSPQELKLLLSEIEIKRAESELRLNEVERALKEEELRAKHGQRRRLNLSGAFLAIIVSIGIGSYSLNSYYSTLLARDHFMLEREKLELQ